MNRMLAAGREALAAETAWLKAANDKLAAADRELENAFGALAR
jgi:hypothetical protein